MVDGTLLFETALDNSGFKNDVGQLSGIATVALGNIASNIIQQVSSAVAQVPAQMVAMGSDFEAAMSQVAATSGITAISDEYKMLSAAAKEMGATTQFSASQASEALNYLALAGYNAEKSITALPTILNVAAAGGMELAAASDLITDAMSALGLQMDELVTFTDKIAVAAQKSNTSVAQLGEAILTVGGTAKNLSGGITELTTMLGVLADNGIKGAEGGTALRNIILALTAPMNVAKDKLNELNVKVFDAEGNMRALTDVFADLNNSLSTLTQEERTQALNDIFNKVDLKSANALLGTSGERFEQLAGYIDDCDGAAAQMAETMNDNLKGDITIMKSALEGLGIAAYEKFQVPMRTAVQSISDDISDLTNNLISGSLSQSIDKVADGFSKIAVSAANVLANQALPAVISALEWITDNENAIVGALTAIVSGFLAFKGIMFIQALPEIIMLTTSAIMAMNPVILAASAAIAAITAVMVLYNKEKDREMALAARGADLYQSNLDGVNALADSYQEVCDSADSLIEKSSEQSNVLSVLKKKLDEQVDANGKVIGNEQLVKEIISEINEIYPENIELINGQIQGYNELTQSLDDYLSKRSEETLLNAKKEKWVKAVVVNYDASKKDEALYADYEEADRQYKKALAALEYYHTGMYCYTDEDEQRANELGMTVKRYLEYQYQYTMSAWEAATEAYTRNKDLMLTSAEDIADYEDTLKEKTESSTEQVVSTAEMIAREIAENTTKINQQTAEALSEQQKKNLEKLKEKWSELEHEYRTGSIASDSDLYNKKVELLEKYGDGSRAEFYSYYEDIYDMQQDFADDELKAQKQQIEENKRLTEEAQNENLRRLKRNLNTSSSAVKDSISDIISDYRTAFQKIDSSRESYRNKLLSAGDVFSIIDNDDGSKTLRVEDLRKQMTAMQKYHDNIMTLKASNASTGLLSQLTAMDFNDGAVFAENLAKMGKAEFDEINKYYDQREKLADDLAQELYTDDLNKLNENLQLTVLDSFDKLPAQIKVLGEDAINAFAAGLTGTADLSEQVQSFCGSFFTSLSNGISDMDIGDEFTNLFDAYSAGQNAGDDFASGFNAAMADLEAAVLTEQAKVSASFTASTTATTADTETKSGKTEKAERIVIENHVSAQLNVDGEKMAESVNKYQNVIDQRKGR